jgi:hypothetical protein
MSVGCCPPEDDLKEDRMWYGDWMEIGTWFYAPREAAFYRVAESEGNNVTLKRGLQQYPDSPSQEVDNTDYPARNISELSGAIDGGYLHGIPPGTQRTVSAYTISNTGRYLIISTTESHPPESISELSLEFPKVNIRYTSPDPVNLVGSPNDADSESKQIVAVVTTEDSLQGISHLLPDRNQPARKPADADSLESVQVVGEDLSIDRLPYYPSEDPSVVSRYVPTSEHPAATFEEINLRNFVLTFMQVKGGRVLNACAGPTDLSRWYDQGEIIRNDLHPDVESDLSVDIAELAAHLEPQSFDVIVFDPPWSAYQSNLRYNGWVVKKSAEEGIPQSQISLDVRELPFEVPGEQELHESNETQSTFKDISTGDTDHQYSLNEKEQIADVDTSKSQIGHARLSKLGFDYLLKPGGFVIQFAYNRTIMPSDLDYNRRIATTFDPHGEGRSLQAGVDIKPNEQT